MSLEKCIHGCLALESRLACPDVLLNCQPVLSELIARGAGGTILELHFDIRDRPEPKFSLRQRAGRKQMVLNGKATATNANLLTASRALIDKDVHHEDLAKFILVPC